MQKQSTIKVNHTGFWRILRKKILKIVGPWCEFLMRIYWNLHYVSIKIWKYRNIIRLLGSRVRKIDRPKIEIFENKVQILNMFPYRIKFRDLRLILISNFKLYIKNFYEKKNHYDNKNQYMTDI